MFEQLLVSGKLMPLPIYELVSLKPRPVAGSHVSVCYDDGKVYALDGMNTSTQSMNNADVYDVESDTWSSMISMTLSGSPTYRRSGAAGVVGNRVNLIGGFIQGRTEVGNARWDSRNVMGSISANN